LIRQRQVTLTTPQDISSEALECLLDHLPNLGAMAQRDRALIHLLLHGLRASEAVALNLSSFDGENLFIAQTKTHISRIVPLSRSSQECLNDYIQWRRQELQEATSPDAPLLMAQGYRTAGRRLSYSGLYQAVERIGRSAAQSYLDTWKADHSSAQLEDLPDPVSRVIEQLRQLHPHNFRHTYATGLLLRGLDPAHARKLTGHQSQQVFRRYTERAEQEAVINAFRRLDNQQPWLP
jgi:integrase/recombinase XerD